MTQAKIERLKIASHCIPVTAKQNVPHHGVAGIDFDFIKRWPPPLPCMRWFVAIPSVRYSFELPVDLIVPTGALPTIGILKAGYHTQQLQRDANGADPRGVIQRMPSVRGIASK